MTDDQANGAIVAKTLADHAYQRIRRDIVAGKLAPGSKLRLEALTKRYDVGMSPLREALARLVGDALAVIEGQRGFWVAPLSIEEFEDITRVRGLIETEAMQRSIERGGPEWETAVRKAYDELSRLERKLKKKGDESLPLWEDANRRFHEALVAACGSPWLIRFRCMLYDQSERYRRISLTRSAADRCVHDEHEAIVEAALSRQVLKACRLTELHLRRTADVVREALAAEDRKRA
ncbi:MAG: FCD domain-containing protein [Rhodospirillaceae bacterium]|nr:FCD domain-containing protein [Rhodospirillaceae bacterium]